VVRGNWQKYRKGFCGFSIHKLSKAQADELLKNPNVLKNRIKVEAIIYNAKEFQKIKKEYGSFFSFLGSLRRMADEAVFKLLIRRFRHVGSYTAEYYLHSVGYWE
jgi:DNA-3-methyladenine glycosylase I